MKNRILYLLISVFALSCVPTAAAERIGMPVRRAIGRTLSRIVAREVSGGYVKVPVSYTHLTLPTNSLV